VSVSVWCGDLCFCAVVEWCCVVTIGSASGASIHYSGRALLVSSSSLFPWVSWVWAGGVDMSMLWVRTGRCCDEYAVSVCVGRRWGCGAGRKGKGSSSHMTLLLVRLSLISIGFGCSEAPPTLRGRPGCCQQEGVDGGGDYHTRSVFLLPLPCSAQLQEGN